MTNWYRLARQGGIAVLALGYALLAHHTNTRPGSGTLGTLVALAPILLATFSLAWHAARRTLMLGLFVLACIALLLSWSRLQQQYGRIYWLEHAGTELMLCVMFARTLAAGREPMCTYFARMVHGVMTPALAQYTRAVTRAWVLFFGAMAAVSTILFYTTPLATWSVFANFFTAPLIGAMFVLEYAVRRQVLRDMDHAHILDGIKAFWKQPAR